MFCMRAGFLGKAVGTYRKYGRYLCTYLLQMSRLRICWSLLTRLGKGDE